MSCPCCVVYGPAPWPPPLPLFIDTDLIEKLRAIIIDFSEISVVDPLEFDEGEG